MCCCVISVAALTDGVVRCHHKTHYIDTWAMVCRGRGRAGTASAGALLLGLLQLSIDSSSAFSSLAPSRLRGTPPRPLIVTAPSVQVPACAGAAPRVARVVPPGQRLPQRGVASALRQSQPGQEGEPDADAEKTPLPISFDDDGKLLVFGMEATGETWAIALVYFVQGILGISRLAGQLRRCCFSSGHVRVGCDRAWLRSRASMFMQLLVPAAFR